MNYHPINEFRVDERVFHCKITWELNSKCVFLVIKTLEPISCVFKRKSSSNAEKSRSCNLRMHAYGPLILVSNYL